MCAYKAQQQTVVVKLHWSLTFSPNTIYSHTIPSRNAIYTYGGYSYTFEQVQGKAQVLWMYHYYAVVYEHFDRPYIPLFGTLYQMFTHAKCSKCCGSLGAYQSTDFSKFL